MPHSGVRKPERVLEVAARDYQPRVSPIQKIISTSRVPRNSMIGLLYYESCYLLTASTYSQHP